MPWSCTSLAAKIDRTKGAAKKVDLSRIAEPPSLARRAVRRQVGRLRVRLGDRDLPTEPTDRLRCVTDLPPRRQQLGDWVSRGQGALGGCRPARGLRSAADQWRRWPAVGLQ